MNRIIIILIILNIININQVKYIDYDISNKSTYNQKISNKELIIQASVISRNKNLIINKGSLNGIKDNMLVFYNGFLIGYIYNTNLYSSEVIIQNNNIKNIEYVLIATK